MLKRLFLSGVLVILLALMHQSSWAEGTGLPKAPNWAFGAEIPIYKEMGVTYKGPVNGPNPAVENAKILNSWGYKARPIEEIKDLLPEEFYEVLKDPKKWGDFRINEIAGIPIPVKGNAYEKYLEYTEKYKGKCTLDAKGHLQNYIGGQPFPGKDAENDAMKLMWNREKRYYADDTQSPYLISNIEASGFTRNNLGDHLVMTLGNRLEVDPKPLYLPNPTGIDNILSFPYIAPYNVAGTIVVTYRYYDPDKDDDMWMYIPAMRRVRRMSTAQRQDRLPGGMNFLYDTNEGFQGKLERWKWKLVGTKVMLSPCNGTTQAQIDLKGHMTGVDNRYYRTKMYIIEGTPDKAVTVSKIRLYLDSEHFQIVYSVNYDIKGRPWFFQYYGYGPDGKWIFQPHNMFSLDLQRNYSTRAIFVSISNNEGFKPQDFSMEALRQKYQQR